MKIIKLIIFGLYISSCSVNSEKSAIQLWNIGQNYRIEDNLKGSISTFKKIIKKYPAHDMAAKAQFQIADIYLNDVKDFEYAVEEFKKVVKEYPTHEFSKKSLFMIAYIYNNYLEAYSDAIINYNLFAKKYPDDDLIPSVQYELNGLRDIQSTIDSLNSIVNKKLTL